MTEKSTADYLQAIWGLKQALEQADTVVIGAGAGLSEAAGLAYSGARFAIHFPDFKAKYQLQDMYSATFYPYASPRAFWAYMSRHILLNRYAEDGGAVYASLLELVKNKDYFVLTTNVDHCFQKAGFDKQRLFYTQGDYGLWQCATPCHQKTYDNEDAVRQMADGQKKMEIPPQLVPYCPKCGGPMAMNLRCDSTFVEDVGWHQAAGRYAAFMQAQHARRVLFLELGVGENTPGIIKYPFWQMTAQNPKARYVCVNLGEAAVPQKIIDRASCIQCDIGKVLEDISKIMDT